MAINLMCTKCKKTHKLTTLKCSCGSNLKNNGKYRVRARTPQGWKSKTASSLSEAKKFEQELLMVTATASQELSTPTLADVWSMYQPWAEIHKKSWKADQSRYTHHLKSPLALMEMDTIKPYLVQTILNKMHGSSAPSTLNHQTSLGAA